MKDTDFQPVLDDIVGTLRPVLGQAGTVASYIPALACIDPRQLGVLGAATSSRGANKC